MNKLFVGMLLILTISLFGCVSDKNILLSNFEENKTILGKVVENNDGCVVDATCFLKIKFSDRIIDVIYGYGWYQPCSITKEVSDVAFDVKQGDLINVSVSNCGSEGYYIKQIEIIPKTSENGIALQTSCQADEDCHYLISHNTCELFCANFEESNDDIISNLEVKCDSTLWDPPLELNCSCVNSNCQLHS